MSTMELIREKLSQLSPIALEITDDSASHAGHAGSRDGGGHYEVLIVSSAFEGMNMVARHRLIYATLGHLMQNKVHALSIKALSENEM